MKRVVTIQDISCFGKCSLTVALPIISAMGVEMTNRGTILADEETFLTSEDAVFAIGDASNKGASIAIEAVGEGERAAKAVDAYLKGEPMKMRNYSIEIPFYLYFLGLEAFCKQYIKSFIPGLKINEKDIRQNIAPVLEKLGINYIFADWSDGLFNWRNKKLDKDEFLRLSISTYSNLRNSLFHQNLFIANTENSTKFKKKDGKQIRQEETVKITDYDYYLHRLCNVVILKYIGIQNINLDCSKWYTRFQLIS